MTTTRYNQIRKMLAVVGVGAMALFTVLVTASTTHAATEVNTNTRNWSELYILSELFDNGNFDFFSGDNNFGELIVLDEVLGNRNMTGSYFSGINGNSNLTDLFILTQLFDDNGNGDNGSFANGNGDNNLGELFVLSELFNGGSSILGNDTVVVVQSGDTLSQLAAQYYGDASLYPVIANANNISNPNLIRVGQRLVIPSLSNSQMGTGSDLTDLFILNQIFNND